MTSFHPSFKSFEAMIKTNDVQISVSKFFTSLLSEKYYFQFIEITYHVAYLKLK